MLIPKIKPFELTMEVDPDKSITHRALILGAIAEGGTKVYTPSVCNDCNSTLKALKALGVSISKTEGAFSSAYEIRGKIASGEFFIDAENSGTTARLLMGLLSGQRGVSAVLSGDDSLRKRPMSRVAEPLIKMGANIDFLKENKRQPLDKNGYEAGGISGVGRLPLRVKGRKLGGIDYALQVCSAQLKSAVLIAALSAEGKTTLSGKINSRNHTELLLSAMGANLDLEAEKISVYPSVLRGIEVEIGGDFSSAIYFLVLALLNKNSQITVKNVNVNPTRAHALNFLKRIGANIELNNIRNDIEPTCDITAVSSLLSPFRIGEEEAGLMIDELPLLAAAACFIEGESVIEGASELRLKESDRITAIAEGLTKMGASITVLPDGLIVSGKGGLKGGCKLSSYSDHRIEMSLSIAAMLSKEGAEIEEGFAPISFPSFYKLLKMTIEN